LNCFAGRHGPSTRAHGIGKGVGSNHPSGWMAGRDADGWHPAVHSRHTARAQSAIAIEAATVIRPLSIVAVLSTTHGTRLVQATIMSHTGTVPAGGTAAHHGHAARWEVGHAAVGSVRHAGKAEAAGSAVVALARSKWEVTIAIGIGPRGSNACGVKDI
jgi:hypothetical protein